MFLHICALSKSLIIFEIIQLTISSLVKLVIIMHNREEIAREFAKAIKSDYIIKIILFGSVAREEDTSQSDIDILIVTNHREKIEEKIDDEVAWIMHDKHELVSAHIMSEERFINTQHFSFLSNVLSEGIEIG